MKTLHLTKALTGPLCIALQSGGKKHRVWLSDDQAMKLAYRLMSLGSGGETRGIETVEVLP